MNIEYEISSAVLEEELENLTTHVAGHVYEQDDKGSKVSIAHILCTGWFCAVVF